MNPLPHSAPVQATPSNPPLMFKAGTWTLWISLLLFLLPGLLLGVAIIWRDYFWDPNTPPGLLEFLMWSPILVPFTTLLAVLGLVAGLLLRKFGKRSAQAG